MLHYFWQKRIGRGVSYCCQTVFNATNNIISIMFSLHHIHQAIHITCNQMEYIIHVTCNLIEYIIHVTCNLTEYMIHVTCNEMSTLYETPSDWMRYVCIEWMMVQCDVSGCIRLGTWLYWVQLHFQKRKTPTADFLINISSLDILKTLLYQCRSGSKLCSCIAEWRDKGIKFSFCRCKYVLAQSAHAFNSCKTYFSSLMAHAHML